MMRTRPATVSKWRVRFDSEGIMGLRDDFRPFHMVHADEIMFTKMLKKFFPVVERIDECGKPEKSVFPYTLKGDNPDIIVRKGGS